MFALDSPAISEGMAAWKIWQATLAAHPAQADPMVRSEQARAARMIELLDTYPQGLSVNDPAFKAGRKAWKPRAHPES